MPPEGLKTPSALDVIVAEVISELEAARRKFPAFNSGHEGYAVILEELDELWSEVRDGNDRAAREECIQVAAMALRFLIDVSDKHR